MTLSRRCVGDDRRWSPRGVIGTALALSLLAGSVAARPIAATAHADPDDTSATVLRIVDGDTVDVLDDTRGRLRIRVLGIDTPETKKPGYSVGCWGPQATEFATSALLGDRVAVIPDTTQDLHDRYGRSLAYLDKPGGWDYSIEAARNGAARAYVYGHTPVSRAADIAAAEQDARAGGRGLWGSPCYGHTDAIPLR
jgi:micrococcal nuclease